jgi:ABC transport system ATP-binding/permease protein
MSEELLKALMQLFAIIAKQDGGVEVKEREFVTKFLEQQINPEKVEEYLDLFDTLSGQKAGAEEKSLTSVNDSVKILGICKKINKTLSQKQKVVVLVRLYELIISDRKFTEQRMAIIDTAAEVFKIAKEEYKAIEAFVKSENYEQIENDPSLLVFHNGEHKLSENIKEIISEKFEGIGIILKVESVDLYFLRYIGSEELMINSQSIHGSSIYLFANGSIIRLPKGKPIYYSDVVARYLLNDDTIEITYNVKNLSFKFPNGMLGLRNITLSEQQGRLIGIMGASGSGKTTLLNVLSGIEKPSDGEVLINGVNLHTEKDRIKGIIGYIPQDDILIEELTVFENLYFNAKLCFKDTPEDELIKKVDATLQSLGLLEKKELKVGSPLVNKTISGGQRKRLNIALELIREPAILFVDEPTSGLSSRDSENIIDLLRELTLKGKLIFVVIHQPSSDIYKMFDKVVILDTGGYLIYNDNPVEAVRYFKKIDMQINSENGECPKCGNVNPEQIFNIIETKVVDDYGNYTLNRKISPTKWEDLYKENNSQPIVPDNPKALPSLLQIPSRIKQFIIYLIRDLFSKLSNKQYLIINLVESPLLAFILAFMIRYVSNESNEGYVYRFNDNIYPYIFMAIIVALFIGMTVSAEEIFRDRKILKREAFLNLSRSSYLFSKISILFFISAIQTILFVLVGNYILEIKGMWFEYWLVLFTISTSANMLGLIISSAFNSAVTIYILIPLLIIPQMMLSGAMFNFDKLNSIIGGGKEVPPIVAEVIPARWAFEGLVVNQFTDNTYQKMFYDLDRVMSICDYKSSLYYSRLIEVVNKYDDSQKNKTPFDKNDIYLLRKEIIKELSYGESRKAVKFEYLQDLKPENFNFETSEYVRMYLDEMKEFYTNTYNSASEIKDSKIQILENNPKKDMYKYFKNSYYNDNLSDVVLNSIEKQKILRKNNELIQNYDKIFLYPINTNSIDFRAHFYAPKKQFLGTLYPTFWFNIVILWIFTLLMYFVLYFDILKRLLDKMGKISFRSTKKK